MGYRTLEISTACEIHIKEGQLEITSDAGTILIPIEDLSQNKVSLMTLDEKYLPTSIVLPFEGHARQSKLMHAQVSQGKDVYLDLWLQIINRKISNQARALSIMGMEGAENISKYLDNMTAENIDITEALSAKEYFTYYHEGLNRRGDDLIEPYRAMVDIVAHNNIGSNVQLSKIERREIAHVLHNTCMIDGVKVNVMSAIDMMVESLKRIMLDNSSEKLMLPIVLPVESMEGITE